MTLQRYYCPDIGKEYGPDGHPREPVAPDDPRANLLSSEIVGDPGRHKVVLDIDMHCELRPSQTPGHFHLLIDTELDWAEYEKLLWALADAGIVESGYVTASIERGATFIATKPWKPVVLG